MKRIHAIISGEVQGVGYREEVKRIAFNLNISGWVMNLEEGSVELIAEGESKNITDFLDKINIQKYPIFVEEMKVEDEIYKGDIRSFKVIRDKDIQKEILSALSRGTIDIHEVKEVLFEVKEDTSAMLEKQDSMLEKQDSMLEKQDSLQNTVEHGFKEVKNEIHLLRDDFKEVFMSEVNELREEIKELRHAITRIEKGMAKGVA